MFTVFGERKKKGSSPSKMASTWKSKPPTPRQWPLIARYEKYERVENGDFNWVTENFIAFASPQEPEYEKKAAAGMMTTSTSMDSVPSGPCTPLSSRSLPRPFRHVLHYFTTHDVGLVVRLNSALYDKRWFIDRGIDHVEMEFEDGTCPELATVKAFIIKAQNVIDNNSATPLSLHG